MRLTPPTFSRSFLIHISNLSPGTVYTDNNDNNYITINTGIYITKIISGGAADKDGTLQVGDRILLVSLILVILFLVNCYFNFSLLLIVQSNTLHTTILLLI